ncbi:hypothetical protein GMRT_14533 [Giardia muris]|uniref:CS domain-containing protein n=1 Tax=Giardia muris TaxID=5742 RepID=A0A4Z1T4Z2_GIAMU|nr:hypothetical protein GMRT_14533 [Giardia muris]|eukprot:TNJ29073.1 hypothetical protein GMRT_14533 [Giardia muris]
MTLSFEYEVEQTEKRLEFSVAIPPTVAPKSLEVTVTDLCITITSTPNYVLNLDLAQKVQLDDLRCRFRNRTLFVDVAKALDAEGIWNVIIYEGTQQELQRRRDEAFQRYRQYEIEKKDAETKRLAQEQRRQLDADILARQKRTAEEKARREAEIDQLRDELNAVALHEEDMGIGAGSGTGPTSSIPDIRTESTITIESSFTKRKLAVPAREGRDIYVDAQLGPIVAPSVTPNDLTKDIKEGEHKRKLSPFELLDQARRLVSRGKYSDYPAAIELARQASEQAPLSLDAIVLYASLALHEGRAEVVLEVTDAGLTIVEHKHPLQRGTEGLQYSGKIQATLHSLRYAALCQCKKVREALKHAEQAVRLLPEEMELRRDRDLLDAIVRALG